MNSNGHAVSLKPTNDHGVWPSSPRAAIKQGSDMQRFAYQSACELATSDGEGMDIARVRAQALSAILRSWTDVRQQVRIEQGKPGPGNLRPEKVAKQPKGKSRSLPEPSACGPAPTTGSVPIQPAIEPTPQE